MTVYAIGWCDNRSAHLLIEIDNVPQSQILKLEKRILRVLDELPDYLRGKFILKTPYSEHKGKICGKIFAALDNRNGGDASQDSIMITNQNQYSIT